MTASSITTQQRLTPRELRAWPEPVSIALLAIVNHRGIRHRIIDGSHLLLFPPERTARPVKFSASRPAEANLHFLEEFTAKYLGPITPEPRDDRPATDEELAQLVSINGDRQAETPDVETEEWRPHLTKDGKLTTFETNGRLFRCTECGWITETGSTGAHASHHARRANMVPVPHLRGLLDASSLTRVQVAASVGVDKSTVAEWARTGRVKSKYVPALAAALDVRVSELTDQADPEPEPAPEPVPEPVAAAPIESVTEPESTSESTDAHAVLRQIARLIDDALGRDNLETELRDTRARLGEAEAQLDLIREAMGLAK